MGQSKGRMNTKKMQTSMYREVVSLLTTAKSPQDGRRLPLAHDLVSIINSYTGDDIVRYAKECKWGPNVVPEQKNSITNTTRRIRTMDRLVQYASEEGYSYADIYNAFYAISPLMSQIIRLNKGQEWEPSDDWYIYDIYARVALCCVPNKSISYRCELGKKIFDDVNRMYAPEVAYKVKKFIKFLEQNLQRTNFYVGDKTFGERMCECVEHFCYLGMADTGFDQAATVIDTTHLILHFSFIHPKLWFNSPFLLAVSAVNSAVTFTGLGQFGNWYRVQCRTAVRAGVTLDSDQLQLLNTGSYVHVIENFGRRVQIDQPVRGFCSLHDGAGLDILRKASNSNILSKLSGFTHDDLQSPFRDMTRWIFTDRTTSYRGLKAMFTSPKHSAVALSRFQGGRLVTVHELAVDMEE